MKPKTQLKGVILLILTAFIWGLSFVAQSVGIEYIGPFTFGGIRILMGAVTLLPVILIRDKASARTMSDDELDERRVRDKKTFKCGIILGLVFCVSTNLQQYAFSVPGASAGKIAFVTAMYMFFVPFLGLVFLKKKVPVLTWICVVFGFVGLYFLCFTPGDITSFNLSDILSAACAVAFSVHILLVEKFAPYTDGIKLSCIQFAVAGTITCILMFIFENPQISAIKSALLPLLYAGVMSCGLAYTFQIIGQRSTESTVASIIMCTESVFAVLGSAIILHEIPTPRELFGCTVMFAAILLSQLSGTLTAKFKKHK